MTKNKRLKNRPYFRVIPSRLAYFSAAFLLIAGLAMPIIMPRQGRAGLVTSRSLKLSSSAKGDISVDSNGTAVPAGEGGNGTKAKHTVTFTMDTNNATTGSIIIMYCTSPIFSATCTTPTSMTAANLTAVTVSGLNATSNFTIDTATSNATINSNAAVNTNGVCNGAGTTRDNCVAMKRGSAQAETGKPTATIAYGGGSTDYITNPIPAGNENYTFYARILVFSDLTYSTLVDYGGLAASTAQQVDILAKVQEILRFSVGTTSTAKVSNAACTAYSDTGALTLGDANDVLDPAVAYDDYSFFRINTNTVNGAVIYYSGDTLKSGANDINEIGSGGSTSTPGTEQFGLGINSTPPGGAQDYEFTDLTATAPYNAATGTLSPAVASFAFEAASKTVPKQIASSAAGITCDTGNVRYLANISTSTPAGIYRTTITYIATGTY